jgi:uncharacterized protein YxjI
MAAQEVRTMIDALNRRLFFVREHAGVLRASHDYDVLDPETGQKVFDGREKNLSRIRKLLRFSDFKRICPFDLQVTTPEGKAVLRVARGVPILVSRVRVFDAEDTPIGGFVLKPVSVSGAFDVVDATDAPVCRLKGDLTGWNFRFLTPEGIELARVTKKWAGIGKELFSGASDYMLQIDEAVPKDSVTRQLLLASVLCIGMVLKIDT